MMAHNKTIETQDSVTGFLTAIADGKRRSDFTATIDLISKHTGFEPKMWGPSIVGFGIYHYKYESGREGTAPLAAIASRKNAITLYLGSEFDQREELLSKFGRHKTGKGCVYFQKLEDIDTAILTRMVTNSIAHRKKQYPD
jgi:hypothetical protein